MTIIRGLVAGLGAMMAVATLRADFSCGMWVSTMTESSEIVWGQRYYICVEAEENSENSQCAVTVYRSGAFFGSATGDPGLNAAFEAILPGSFTGFFTSGNGDEGEAGVDVSCSPDTSAPDAPTGLAAIDITKTSFTLTWSDAYDNSGSIWAYDVARNGISIGIDDYANTSRIVENLVAGTTYYMSVRARDPSGHWSGWSGAIPVTTLGDIPVITSPISQVGGAGTFMRYIITATQSPTSYGVIGLPAGFSVNSSTGEISGTPPQSGTFVFTLTATNQWGTATRDVTFEIRRAQTITFPAIDSRTLGDPPFSLSANASSGLPVTYNVASGPVSLAGATVTITAAGVASITAIQAGNADYAPAAPVTRTFTVAKATQSIAFPPIGDKTDGAPPFSLAASADSLLPVLFEVVSGPALLNGSTLTITGPGVVTIRASQAGDDQFLPATPVDQSFQVAVSPVGRALEVQNGTGGQIIGATGDQIWISAIVPPGKYFAGWSIVSGDGYIADIASETTTFTLGSLPAVVQAVLTTSPTTRGVAWNEINLPQVITASDGSMGPYVTLNFNALVTNTGTAPWSRAMNLSVYNSNNEFVGGGGVNNTGGAIAGTKKVIFLDLWAPNAPGSYFYTVYAKDYPSGSATPVEIARCTISIMVAARTGTPPQLDWFADRTGTVNVPINASVVATNSPSYSAIGTLPPGISLSSSGQITGTPTQAGEYCVLFVATNASGNTATRGYFQIYPETAYTLSVSNGTVAGGGSTKTITVGSSANIVASDAPAGQIFNGWEVLNSAPVKLGDWRSTSTSVTLNRPANPTVRANIVAGNPLTVERGQSMPLGGAAGAIIALTANGDANGMMFDHWSTTGPGTLTNSDEQEASFTMGGSTATVTANFVPGYRLTVGYGTAGARGGLPGVSIPIWPTAPTASGYSFEGFWMNGPGWLSGNSGQVTMGKGATAAYASWWPIGAPLTRTLVWPPSYYSYHHKNEEFTMTIATDYAGAVAIQQIDYSLDGGNTWIVGKRAAPESIVGDETYHYRWQSSYRKPGGFPDAGMVVFRGKAEAPGMMNPVYFFMPNYIMDIDSAAFITHPSSISADVGQDVTFVFSATAEGGRGDVVYQWRKDGIDIPGKGGLAGSGTTQTLQLANVQPGDAGVYTVAIKVGVEQNWASSNPATLVVSCSVPTIVTQPRSQTIIPGAAASFSVRAAGAKPYAYQWYRDGVAISAATSDSVAINNASSGAYTVVVTNPCGSVTSQSAILTINADAPAIASAPTSASVNQGDTASFSVAAGGTGPFAYQWSKSGLTLLDATASTLTIPNVKLADEGGYSVTITNAAGSVTSAEAVLTVLIPNPYGDANGDGILNGIVARLGVSTSEAISIDNSDQARLRVHKP